MFSGKARESSSRMVMQTTADFLVGGSKPRRANLVGWLRRRQSIDQDSNRPKNCSWLRYHSTKG